MARRPTRGQRRVQGLIGRAVALRWLVGARQWPQRRGHWAATSISPLGGWWAKLTVFAAKSVLGGPEFEDSMKPSFRTVPTSTLAPSPTTRLVRNGTM